LPAGHEKRGPCWDLYETLVGGWSVAYGFDRTVHDKPGGLARGLRLQFGAKGEQDAWVSVIDDIAEGRPWVILVEIIRQLFCDGGPLIVGVFAAPGRMDQYSVYLRQ